jgi:predicted GNAT superfamily acetyltransferase
MSDSAVKSWNADEIAIRPCTTHTEYAACVDLQVAVWNFAPLDVVSTHLMAVAAETGGQVLGAFHDDLMIGFALSFAAGKNGELYLHSHMLAVLPEYQSRGVGRSLKLAQREDALRRGINKIEWTFDPLQTLNAYFNIEKLGAIVRRYIPNFYGTSSSPLHAALPTDRLVAEWLLNSARVTAHLSGKEDEKTSEVTISIPRDINELRRGQASVAGEQQARIRNEFANSFQQGYVVTGFEVNETVGKYLLRKSHEN